MLRLAVRDGDKHYRITPTAAWVKRHDNGALISCGLTVGAGSLTRRAWLDAVRRFPVEPITQEEWLHSGCLSACKRRGDKECRW